MTRSYMATHQALRRARGTARGLPCVECGRASAVWRCRCDDSSVVVGTNASGRRVTYSTDIAEYDPACWHHANAHDRARAERRRATAHLALNPLPPKPPGRRSKIVSHAAPALFDLVDGEMR